MIRFRDVLKNNNFLLLWLGQVISNFGDRLNQMALVALVYQNRPGSEIALATLISFTIIPVFIIGPIAGAWVDRLNRRNVMVISDITRGILVLTIPLLIVARQMIPIYFVIFLTFSISRFFIPSKMAIIPDLVTKDKLLVANTLSNTTQMIGNVVGLVIAGFIVNIKYIGAAGGFYIDALTFFISATLIAMMSQGSFVKNVREDLVTTTKAIESSIRRSIFREMKEGLRQLMKYDDMRFIVYVFFLLMGGIGAISCVIIIFIQDAFGTSTRDLGFLGMFLAAGLFLGTILYGKFFQKADKKKMVYFSFFTSGIIIICFAYLVRNHPNLLLGGILAWLLGMTTSPIMVSANTLTHETIPDEVRGRIFSALESVIHLAFLIFMFLAAYAAKYIDRMWILVTVGAIFSLCGMVWMVTETRPKTT